MDEIQQEIAASWERCSKKKLSIESPGIGSEQIKIEESIENHQDMVAAFTNIIHNVSQLHETMSIMLTDDKGIVLQHNTYSDYEINKDRLRFGICLKEDICGTNAISLAMQLKVPVLILPEEHYCTFLKRWYCYAVPIMIAARFQGCIGVATVSQNQEKIIQSIGQLIAQNVTLKVYQELKDRKSKKNYGLNKQQIEIVYLLSKGMTTEEISREKYISINTVNYHKKNIMKICQAKTMYEVIAKINGTSILR